jgi:hypothetical protein
MKITLFTSSEPRHIALAESLAKISNELCVCTEVRTFFSGEVDDFFHKSPVMADYFSNVNRAQDQVFGTPRPFPESAQVMAMKLNDLSRVPLGWIEDFLHSDLYIVFGASFIKGPLISFLVDKRAVNIHMGISPLYRGNSCNFWAAYDGRADLIGATIHELTSGLDSGPMLMHTLPKPVSADPFLVGMLAVKAAHEALVSHIQAGDLLHLDAINQDKSLEIRYTKNADFHDDVATEYLERLPSSDEVLAQMKQRDISALHNPYIADLGTIGT